MRALDPKFLSVCNSLNILVPGHRARLFPAPARRISSVASVTLNRISKTFSAARGEVHAVRDLSFEVKDKELLVLAGPSGCGKTTTLRLIAGLEKPTAGSVS